MQRVEPISAFAWVDRIELADLDAATGVCRVRPRRGHRDIAGFVTPKQCERLAAELTKLTARRCRVELVEVSRPATPSEPGQAPKGSTRGERQKALDLPLVKDVIDVFPEAVLMDARAEEEQQTEEDPKKQ